MRRKYLRSGLLKWVKVNYLENLEGSENLKWVKINYLENLKGSDNLKRVNN